MTGDRVLVVEDNERNMKLFRDVLDASGYRTLEATTGEEAVAMACEFAPDLVLLDIQLPDLDGVQALHRLRANTRVGSASPLPVCMPHSSVTCPPCAVNFTAFESRLIRICVTRSSSPR